MTNVWTTEISVSFGECFLPLTLFRKMNHTNFRIEKLFFLLVRTKKLPLLICAKKRTPFMAVGDVYSRSYQPFSFGRWRRRKREREREYNFFFFVARRNSPMPARKKIQMIHPSLLHRNPFQKNAYNYFLHLGRISLVCGGRVRAAEAVVFQQISKKLRTRPLLYLAY